MIAAPEFPELSIVVPCRNEAMGLKSLLSRLDETVKAEGLKSVEILLVDDGSTDATWAQMRALAEVDPRVVAAKLTRNFGHQKALSCGLELSRGAQVLVLDADLQDPPELLSEMRRKMSEGAEVVYGQRRRRAGESAFKKLTAHLFYRLLGRISDVPIPPDTGDFRLMSRRAVDLLCEMPERERFVRGMVAWIGLEQQAVIYDRAVREQGQTNYPLGRMIRLALTAITSFSVLPLRFAAGMGVVMAGVAVLLMLYSMISWIFFDTVSGWTSLVTITLLIGGVQLMVLGIVGEYVGQIYSEVKRRPVFLVEEIIGARSSTHLGRVHGREN